VNVPHVPECPYVGLRPFGPSEQAFFFGRNPEIRVISANLFASPLTVLYGPSAVGKSSVLQAGVVPRLQVEPRTAVVYFNRWQDPQCLDRLKRECRTAISQTQGHDFAVDDDAPLDLWIERALAQFSGQLLVILDQFEEYLLYHPEKAAGAFDSALAKSVNHRDRGAHFLLGLRDEGLARLDRFSKRIPNLLGNTIRLQRLSLASARDAIEGPLRVYNDRQPPGASCVEMAADLIPAILEQVRADRVSAGVAFGRGEVSAPAASSEEVETTYLQLVLEALWTQREQQGDTLVVGLSALDRLGGAQAIAKRHFDQHLDRLRKAEPLVDTIVVDVFPYLVTPTGSKIAQTEEDLVALSSINATKVRWFLGELVTARLLRLTDPPERLEIFHDALAASFLACRNELVIQRAQAQRETELAEAARKRRMRFALLVVTSLTLLLAALTYWALEQARTERTLRTAGELRTSEAEIRRKEAVAQKASAEERLAAGRLALQAREAELDGRIAEAKELGRLADEANQRAAARGTEAEQLSSQAENLRKQAEAQEAEVKDPPSPSPPAVDDVVVVEAPPVTPQGSAASVAAPPATTVETGPDPAVVPEVRSGPEAPTTRVNPAGVVSGDYRAIYREAVNARQRKQWSAAAELMSAAAELRGDTAEVVPLGGFGNTERYLPFFYLGLARATLKDCPGALEAWARSESLGEIQKHREHALLVKQRAACDKK
jgi:hypothetical protein